VCVAVRVAVRVAAGVFSCVWCCSETPLFANYFGSVCCSSVAVRLFFAVGVAVVLQCVFFAVCVSVCVAVGVLQCVLQRCCKQILIYTCICMEGGRERYERERACA